MAINIKKNEQIRIRCFILFFLLFLSTISEAQNCRKHKFVEGMCTRCGTLGPIKKIVAEISSSKELVRFAELVNSCPQGYYLKKADKDGVTMVYYVYVDAILTNDIVLNNQVLDKDGNLIENYENLYEWKTIGYDADLDGDGRKEKIRMCGTFNGNGHTISGVYINQPYKFNQGFIYATNGDYEDTYGITEVLNLGIVDSYINGDHCVGAIAGYAYKSHFKNCFAIAKVVGDRIGTVCGESHETIFTNCFYHYGFDIEATQVSKSQILSGELTYKLNGNQSNIIWGQNIGIDKYPKSYNGKNKVKIIYSN
ncbi:MAG: hypothetical protein MJ211_00160 [Bacteroidales bacterium]|nr:hypothetical protein [Bacteroidales bacterium]